MSEYTGVGDFKARQALAAEWQARLRLSDWRIVLKDGCLPDDMRLPNCAGETEWEEINRCAVIRIPSADCYGDRIVPMDYEKTLVHELLHLKLALLGESGNELQDRYVHQLIEDLAQALVAAKRESAAAKGDAPC